MEVVRTPIHLLWVWFDDLHLMAFHRIGVGMNNRILKNALILNLLYNSIQLIVGLQKRIVLIVHVPRENLILKLIYQAGHKRRQNIIKEMLKINAVYGYSEGMIGVLV
jgi:hypothetical protein